MLLYNPEFIKESNIYDLSEGEDVNTALSTHMHQVIRQKQTITTVNGINMSGYVTFYINTGLIAYCMVYGTNCFYYGMYINNKVQGWTEMNPTTKEIANVDFTKLHNLFPFILPFCNWSNEANFPRIYGNGLILPCPDSTFFDMLYTSDLRLWIGRHWKDNTFQWYNVAGRMITREFTITFDSTYGIASIDLESELKPLGEMITSIIPVYFFDLTQADYNFSLVNDYCINVICRERKGETMTFSLRIYINRL